MRVRAIEARDAPQPPQHVGQVAAKHAAIGVQFVQHDVAQIFKQPLPARVVRQDPRMQHVRIREYDVAPLADGFARVRGRIAVVGKHAEAIVEPRGEIVQFGELILRERLGGEEIQRARVRIFQHGVQHRQVVAQRFSGSGRRDDDDVAPLMHGFGRRGLMAVQFGDALLRICAGKFRADPLGHGREFGVARRDVVHGSKNFSAVVALGQLLDDFTDTRKGEGIFGTPHRERLSHFRPPRHFAFYSLTLARRVHERNADSQESFKSAVHS